MRKLISLMLVLALSLSLASALAEQDNFLISDWTLLYTYEDNAIAEQTIFIYEDGTFDVMDEGQSMKGNWTFDGETLTLTGGDETLPLKWDEAAHRFTGEYNGMTLTMVMAIEPEDDGQPAEETLGVPTGTLAGGWSVAEDPAISDELNQIFWQAMDSYQTGIITVSYTPVAYLGSQVVAGTNYAVLCRSQEINESPIWVIVYLYQDLEGNASVLNVTELQLGIE